MNRIGNLIAVFFPYKEMAFNVSRASVCGFFFAKLIWSTYGAKKGNIGIVPS